MDKLNIDAWAGREVSDIGGLTEGQAAQVHATIGVGTPPREGSPMPPLWHWCAFPNAAQNDHLGSDGHVRGSRVLPPVPLRRRMWAGGALTFHRTLRVGEPIARTTRVRSVSEKSGRTGPMVLVTLDHHIHGASGLAIEERQDIVYLDIPDTFEPPEKKDLPVAPSEKVDTPETLLFRYSAITFNAHRIHYDLRYTQRVERYPSLVVHGPLQASLLMRAATRHKGRPPLYFDFRGVHPMFAGASCDIALRDDEDGVLLWSGQHGHQCMQAKAVWEETL